MERRSTRKEKEELEQEKEVLEKEVWRKGKDRANERTLL